MSDPSVSATPAPSDGASVPRVPSRAEVLLERALVAAGGALRSAGRALAERRGLRCVVIGGVLTFVALELGGGSALSLPLLALGIGMIVVGAMGPRLGGRLDLEFGPGGTTFTMQTHLAPPGRRLAVDQPAVAPAATPRGAALTPPEADGELRVTDARRRTAPALSGADVVESHGETVELDVAQLRALLAAERVDAERAAARERRAHAT